MGPHIFKIWYYLLAKLFQFVKKKQQFNGRLVMCNLNKLITFNATSATVN
jgi:hypothetical protein